MAISDKIKAMVALLSGMVHEDSSSGGAEMTKGTGQAAWTLEQGTVGGERNTSSATNNYTVTKNECNATVLSTTAAVTIGGGAADDTYLLGVHIHTALAGTCVIAGFVDESGAAKSYTLPATTVGHVPMYAARNLAGALTVTCGTAGDDDKVMVLWRPRV